MKTLLTQTRVEQRIYDPITKSWKHPQLNQLFKAAQQELIIKLLREGKTIEQIMERIKVIA